MRQEWACDPPVGIHSVDSNGVLFSIDNYSLINALLIESHIVKETSILVLSLYDFYGVGIDHLDGRDCGSGVGKVVHKGPLGSLGPCAFFEMML